LARKRKRKRKQTGRFQEALEKERLIKRIARNKSRLKDIRYQEAANSMLAQFSSRGGNLTDKQWSYLKTIDKAPLHKKPTEPKILLKDIQPAVYAIASKNYIKIGHSVRVGKRLESIQTGNAETLKILKCEYCDTHQQALDREQSIHKHFAGKRVRGEWFDISIKDELLMMLN
jgi:hypothetical protein